MALQRAGNPNPFAVLFRQNPQKLILLLLCNLVMISCSDALPATQGVLPKSRLRLYNMDTTTTRTLSAQYSLPPGTVNNPYSGSIIAYGGVAPYSYVVSGGQLPSGLSLDPSTGSVSGTPTVAGINNFKFTVTDSIGASFHNHAQIVIGTINTALTAITVSVTPTSATLASGGSQQFSATVQGTSNTGVSWSASAGSITSGGLFTAPAASSTTNVNVTATSAANPGVQSSATIAVSAATPITVSVSPNTAAVSSGGSQQFSASVGGTTNTAVTWSATTGTITSTGVFTAPVVSSNTSVTVTARSAANSGATSNAAVAVSPSSSTTAPLTITSSTLASGTVGSNYATTLTSSGGMAPISWAVTSGQVPPGLSLASNGALSGQPTTTGTYSFGVQAADSSSPSNTANATITIAVNSAATSTSACSTSPVISNLSYSLSADSKSITVTWDTNIPADTQVQWGDNDHEGGPNSGAQDTANGKTTGHTYTITGLYPRFMYGIYARSRCVDSSGPSLNTNYWATSGFNITPPLATGPFAWAAVGVGPHFTFPGYPLYFVLDPLQMQTSSGAGVNWNYTVKLTLPAGWTFTIDSCGSGCPGFAVSGTSFTRTQYNGSTEWYTIHLNIPAGTVPGAYTVLAHTVDNTFGTSSQDVSWTVNVLNPSSDAVVQAPALTTFPPIPCQHGTSVQANGQACPSSWDSLINLAFTPSVSVASSEICTDNSTIPNGYGSGWEALSWYYDGIRGYQNALKYTGNSAYNTCLTGAIAYLRDRFYLYEPTLPSSSQNWGGGHASFTRGLYTDYVATANSSDLTAISNVVNLATYSSPDLYLVAQNSQRELAYRVEAETVWAQLGHTDRTDLLNRAVAMTIGTLDESCVSQNNTTGPLPSSVEPSFIGLAADALIYYYNNGHQSDVRIPWAIKQCADWMWNNSWVGQPIYAGGPDHYWDYLTDVRLKLGSDADYRGLNGLVFPIYAWLFKYTGNATIPGSDGSQCYGTPGQPCTYQQAGDAAFSSAMATSGNLTTWGWLDKGKTYTQNMRWGFDYINWRTGH